jgi:hypothetical protein
MGSRVSSPSSGAAGPQARLLQTANQGKGRWVALDECRYDTRTAQVIEGSIVDSDEDLVALCNRMRKADTQHCAIVFCAEDSTPLPVRARLAH